MKIKDIKKLLKDQFAVESDLIEFVYECFNDMFYGDDKVNAIQLFDDSYEAYDFNNCLSSLKFIKTQISERKENVKKWQEKQAQEKLLKETS